MAMAADDHEQIWDRPEAPETLVVVHEDGPTPEAQRGAG